MRLLKRIYLKFVDDEILKEIAISLRHLREEHSLAQEGISIVREMAAELSAKLAELTADDVIQLVR